MLNKFVPDRRDFIGIFRCIDSDKLGPKQFRFEDSLGKQFMIPAQDVDKTEIWGLFPVDQKAYQQKYKTKRRKTKP